MKQNTRILIVDDNEAIHQDFKKVLCPIISTEREELESLEDKLFSEDESIENQKIVDNSAKTSVLEYEVDSAHQGQEALKMVKAAEAEGRPYAMAFMDVRMPPGWDGVETISRIWMNFPYIEMVLCTAFSDYAWDEILAKLGSTDKLLFLRKPFDAIAVQQTALTLIKKWNLSQQSRQHVQNLEKEVKERTKQLQLVLDELEQKNQKLSSAVKELKHTSVHDPLTRLPNRILFQDRLQHTIDISKRDNLHFSVVIMDMNSFKEINDTHGHDAGDKLLIEFGKRMQTTLRACDTIARLGGDEFALILLTVNKGNAPSVAAKIFDAINQPIELNDTIVEPSASLGFSFYPDHGTDIITLLKCADIAMYLAKQVGSICEIYNPEEDEQRKEKVKLVHELEDAITNDGLTLYYQPLVDLTTGQVCAVEALSRWVHPERGFVPPDQFIPLAEKKGLIHALTNFVLKTAFQQLAEWHQQGILISIAVNLSQQNFLDPELLEELMQHVNRYQLDPKWVILEITESMAMFDPQKTIDTMQLLRNLGFEIAIDDFGTGYSSLSYLSKLPVKELKIDRSFVIGMEEGDSNIAIVQSTIALSHTLGLKVVAEGVESQAVVDQLQSFGCDIVQGYHLCRPLPADKLDQWFKDSNKLSKTA